MSPLPKRSTSTALAPAGDHGGEARSGSTFSSSFSAISIGLRGRLITTTASFRYSWPKGYDVGGRGSTSRRVFFRPLRVRRGYSSDSKTETLFKHFYSLASFYEVISVFSWHQRNRTPLTQRPTTWLTVTRQHRLTFLLALQCYRCFLGTAVVTKTSTTTSS